MGTENGATTDADKIRIQNDLFRTTLKGGHIVVTIGISTRCDTGEVLRRVQAYSAFNEANDPHHEHDFGAFELGDETIFWKVDYYDKTIDRASPNAADPDVTTRVLTLMLAEEY